MASKSPKLLSDLLAKAEEDLKVSRNGVKTIERLKKIKSIKSVGNNERFKTLLDNSAKCISEEHQTNKVILTIATLYYSQSDDKTSIRWLLKYLTKLKLEVSLCKSEKIEKSHTAEYMLGCCYFNLNNYKMAYNSLKTSPPDPSNGSKFKKHCNMLSISCETLKLWDDMYKYEELCAEENPCQSAIFNVKIRIENAKRLMQFGKISGAKKHLKAASNFMCNCEDELIFWVVIADHYTELKMYPEAYKCRQHFVDSFNGQNLDPPPDKLVHVLITMATHNNQTLVGNYHRAISICQHILELLQKNPEGDFERVEAFYEMADSYRCLSDFGLAINYYEEALEEMKKAHKNSKVDLDYCHLSAIWLRMSESQLLAGSYQIALKSAKKSEKYLKMAPGKFPQDDTDTAVQLSYCWRKLERPQKAIVFMSSAIEAMKQVKKEEDPWSKMDSKNQKMIYIGACQQQLSGTFEAADCLFKGLLLSPAILGIEIVMKTLNSCVQGGRKKTNAFPEDGQLFWSRINHICSNDDEFVSHFPSGFKKHFFRYKNSLEACNHLKNSQ
jgi:tetratricopeptide (TPR) repeat protein